MAGGPYSTRDGWQYIKWSDTRGHPEQPKKTESLKTKSKKIARLRKAKLEDLYDKNKHDPWIIQWYKNKAIRPLIVGNIFDSDIDISQIKPPSSKPIPPVITAVKLYIDYKTPDGDKKTENHQWNANTNAPKMKSELHSFAQHIGPHKIINQLSGDDFNTIIENKNLNSGHSLANVARAWNAFVNYCEEMNWIQAAPTVDVPTPQANIPVFIYNDDLYKMCLYKIQKVKSEMETGFTKPGNSQLYMTLAWILMRYTGMRPIEVQKLYLDAIDIPHRQITIGKKYDADTNRTKTGLQRNIEMRPIVKDICMLLKDPDFRKTDRWMADSDHIFGRPGNTAKKRLSTEFTEARRQVLPERDSVTLYTLRDTFAVSRFSDPSMDSNPLQAMYNIKKDMGHKSIETTEKYWKATPPRFHHQRLHNSKIFYKILQKFY